MEGSTRSLAGNPGTPHPTTPLRRMGKPSPAPTESGLEFFPDLLALSQDKSADLKSDEQGWTSPCYTPSTSLLASICRQASTRTSPDFLPSPRSGQSQLALCPGKGYQGQ